MNCITSPALDNVEIARYVDGEADDAVVAHINQCSFCSERARQWTLLQNRLRKQSYRASCPTPMELGDYHLRLLPASQMLVVAQHVRECPLCRREVAQLDNFLEEPIKDDSLLGAARELADRMFSARKVEQNRAGPLSSPTVMALRGGEDVPVFQFQIVIEAEDDVEQMGLKTLLGLVTGLESNEFTIRVSQENQVIATTSVDEIGNFTVSHLVPGHYRLILSGPNIELHIQSLQVI